MEAPRKKNRRGKGSREKAAEKYRVHRNQIFTNNLERAIRRDDLDGDDLYERMMRMTQVKYALLNGTDYPDKQPDKILGIRVGVNDASCIHGTVLDLPDLPSPTHESSDVACNVFSIACDSACDDGFFEDDIEISASLEPSVPHDSELPCDDRVDNYDAPITSWANEVERELQKPLDTASDEQHFEAAVVEAFGTVKWARKHTDRRKVICATVDVQRDIRSVLVYIPEDFKVHRALRTRYRFMPYRFTSDIERFKRWMGFKIIACPRETSILTHANIYIKYAHPGQVIFCVDSVPFVASSNIEVSRHVL
jgi:hypothetical protein